MYCPLNVHIIFLYIFAGVGSNPYKTVSLLNSQNINAWNLYTNVPCAALYHLSNWGIHLNYIFGTVGTRTCPVTLDSLCGISWLPYSGESVQTPRKAQYPGNTETNTFTYCISPRNSLHQKWMWNWNIGIMIACCIRTLSLIWGLTFRYQQQEFISMVCISLQTPQSHTKRLGKSGCGKLLK